MTSNDQSSDQIPSGTENEDENYNNDTHYIPNKILSETTSSSDLIQGTPTENGVADDFQARFASDNEANSAADLYSFVADCSSNFIQVCTQLTLYNMVLIIP